MMVLLCIVAVALIGSTVATSETGDHGDNYFNELALNIGCCPYPTCPRPTCFIPCTLLQWQFQKEVIDLMKVHN